MKEIGFIFDMDGVLIVNHEYHYQAWQEVAAKYGTIIDEHFYREKMNGRTIPKLVELLFPDKNYNPQEANDIGMEKEARYREIYQNALAPAPGLIDFLEEAKKRNIPMVVGTSAPEENVIFTLDGINIRHYFQGVVDASMVVHGKPDPEVYLKCADMIGRHNQNCIVFEDAVSGLKAGHDAGSKTIGLATSHQKHELQADMLFDSFEEINWHHIEQLLDL